MLILFNNTPLVWIMSQVSFEQVLFWKLLFYKILNSSLTFGTTYEARQLFYDITPLHGITNLLVYFIFL